jgi:hypothetical protein
MLGTRTRGAAERCQLTRVSPDLSRNLWHHPPAPPAAPARVLFRPGGLRFLIASCGQSAVPARELAEDRGLGEGNTTCSSRVAMDECSAVNTKLVLCLVVVLATELGCKGQGLGVAARDAQADLRVSADGAAISRGGDGGGALGTGGAVKTGGAVGFGGTGGNPCLDTSGGIVATAKACSSASDCTLTTVPGCCHDQTVGLAKSASCTFASVLCDLPCPAVLTLYGEDGSTASALNGTFTVACRASQCTSHVSSLGGVGGAGGGIGGTTSSGGAGSARTECRSQSDCPSPNSQTCIGPYDAYRCGPLFPGQGRVDCTDDSQCGTGQICREAAGWLGLDGLVCAAPCTTDLDCPPTEKCASEGRCQARTCAECPPYFSCTSGACAIPTCSTDANCQAGYCVKGSCAGSLGVCQPDCL